MNKTLLAALTPTERLLVSETEPAARALLEEALGRVGARLAALARQSARELREERLAAAAAAKAGGVAGTTPPAPAKGRTVAQKRTGDRSLRSPASEKKRAGNQGANARWQSKRDAR